MFQLESMLYATTKILQTADQILNNKYHGDNQDSQYRYQ